MVIVMQLPRHHGNTHYHVDVYKIPKKASTYLTTTFSKLFNIILVSMFKQSLLWRNLFPNIDLRMHTTDKQLFYYINTISMLITINAFFFYICQSVNKLTNPLISTLNDSYRIQIPIVLCSFSHKLSCKLEFKVLLKDEILLLKDEIYRRS